MDGVGIRELQQNASAVVARAAAGETITITDRGVEPASLRSLEVIHPAPARSAGGQPA